MTDFENTVAVELSEEELNDVAGGAKKPAEKTGYTLYQIKRGDTMIRIANRYHVTVDQLMKWNPQVKNKRLIITGHWLYIKK